MPFLTWVNAGEQVTHQTGPHWFNGRFNSAMRVLLLYPQNPETFWSFKHVLRFLSKKSAFPPLGLLTIAAMLPRHWELKLVDLNVESLGDEHLEWADYILLSGMIVHKQSIDLIVKRCQSFGKPIIAGGPIFTTGHAAFPEIQHFVIGEAEEIMPQLIEDMTRRALRHIYQASGRPDITRAPIPRWDLINFRHYVTMPAQFSRGCPYDCEFCDIIIMNGRVPRTKAPEQFIAELEALRQRGWKEMVFVVDDNFIGDKKRAKSLLNAMIEWRNRTKTRMGFLTEASVNLADDPELCDLMVQAGFKKVFVGLETPMAASLQECHKIQNKGRDLVEAIQIIQRSGMEVMGGFIIGFDNDQQDIFHRQFEFIQRSGVVTAMVGLLTALPQTRLYHRLMREGRLEADSTGNNTQAILNFKPMLNREFLQNGYRELMQQLYEPGAYYQRIRALLKSYHPRGPRVAFSSAQVKAFLRSLWVLGFWSRGRRAYWHFFLGTLLCRPRKFRVAIELAIIGHHFRRVARGL
jgi:radical SAM superfamily enzyme YgiQ (UPF0313 family)